MRIKTIIFIISIKKLLQKFTMKRSILFNFLILLLALSACVKEEEFENLEPVNYTGEWGAPLVNSSVTFEQLLASYQSDVNGDFEITTDENDVYHLIYRDTVESPDLSTYYKIQDVSNEGDISIPEDQKDALPFLNSIPFSTTVKFDTIIKESMSVPLDFEDNTITSASLKYIDLKAGELLIDVKSEFQHQLKLTLTFNSLVKDNEPLTIPIDLKNAGSSSLVVPQLKEDLANYRLDLTAGGTTVDTVQVRVQVDFTTIVGNPINATDKIKLKLELKQLEALSIVGTLGEFKIPIRRGTQAITVFDEEVNDVKIKLEDPTINMNFDNTLGVPFSIEFSELALKNEKGDIRNVELVDGNQIKVGHVEGIENFGTTVSTKYQLTNSSTKNLSNAFEIAPNEFIYDFLAVIGDTTNPDFFLHEAGQVNVALDIDLPLAGAVEAYVFEDELTDVLLTDLDTSLVESAEIRMFIDNGWPITLKVQGYFVNEKGITLDSLFTSGDQAIIASGTIDDNGFVTAPKSKTTIIVLDRERYKKVAKATKIRYKLSVNTGEDGSKIAKILSSYKLGLKLAAKVKMNADLSSVE